MRRLPTARGDRPSRSIVGGPAGVEVDDAEDETEGTGEATDALADRLFRDAVGAFELYTVYLGLRLGLYRALAEEGPATPAELADRTGTTERYIREWLEHHAASGLLEVAAAAAEPGSRRYHLPPAHAPVLADADDLRYQAHMGIAAVRAARPLPALVEAFRSGGGVRPLAWAPEGRGDFNRPMFLNLLGREWLPAIADVDQRLRRDPPARVADIACGTGWSSVAMAVAYPTVTVDGFDLDPDAIAAATTHAGESGVADRVSFTVADATDPGLAGRYDLVTIFEALHDMAHPVEALRAARLLLATDGTLLVADELTEDQFTAPASWFERYLYGWSVLSCLPGAMGDPDSAATGAVMRRSTLERYAAASGFAQVETLPIESDCWRFYRLIPSTVAPPR